MKGQVTFYGASGHSRAIALLIGLPPARPRLCDVAAFVDETVHQAVGRLEDRPVISWETWQLDYAKLPCLVPVGNCVDKRRLVSKVSAAGGVFPQLYEGAHTADAGVSVGYGTIICPSG